MRKKVLITGATGGIGHSIAKEFHSKGYFVILSGRNKEKLTELFERFKINYDVIECDLTEKTSIEHLCLAVSKKHNNVDILINNAGMTDDSLFMRMGEEKWKKVLDVNLNSNFLITNFFLKAMLKNRWGRIINITSVVSHTGNPGQANYCASKAGIIGMSKSIALEVAKRGITVNCISPGFIETSMTQKLSDIQRNNILESIPMAKVGRPEDISKCVLFLASEDSQYITGQTLHVNGGITMV